MEIEIASNSGLCYGVKRALNLALKTRRVVPGNVVVLGDLIHNPGVIAGLKARGIGSAASPRDVRSGTVIIRSHGISPEVRRRLDGRKIRVVDATCPIVKKIQKLVAELAGKGLEVVIVGNRDHPETAGLLGHSRGRGLVIETVAESARLPFRRRRAVLAQSTQDLELFEKAAAALVGSTKELQVYNTICDSTLTRQRSTIDLARRVDVMFVVGGRTSSNTAKLFKMCRRVRRRTYFIETAADIRPAMLKGAEKIGISGGASTPPEAIKEAADAIHASFSRNSQSGSKSS